MEFLFKCDEGPRGGACDSCHLCWWCDDVILALDWGITDINEVSETMCAMKVVPATTM